MNKNTAVFKARVKIIIILSLAICMAAFSRVALAGGPSWWTQMVQDCVNSGGSAPSSYNAWTTQGCICNGVPSGQPTCSGGSSSSGGRGSSSYDSGAALREQQRLEAELEQQRKEAEEKRLREEAERQARFIQDRDEAAKGLKGSSGTTGGVSELKGSNSGSLGGQDLKGVTQSTGLRGSTVDAKEDASRSRRRNQSAPPYGLDCDSSGISCKVFCSNGEYAGTMYWNGSKWSDGIRSDTDKFKLARQIVKAQGTLCQ